MLLHQVGIVSESAAVPFADVAKISAALQKQATRDFGPAWDVSATVDAFQKLEDLPIGYWPIIIQDDINSPGAAGFHTDDHGQPFSLVQASGDWGLSTSHECLEMLADPFGNRTVAGAPPPQATGDPSKLERVEYLVEVCDPCEGDRYAYAVNGNRLSDFLTPHYYDPNGSTGVQYSFRGNVQAPHTILEGGYVSFGDPITNQWYQVTWFEDGLQTKSLGVLNTNGRSVRETIDDAMRRSRPGYRTRSVGAAAMAAAAGPGASTPDRSSVARAATLHKAIRSLK